MCFTSHVTNVILAVVSDVGAEAGVEVAKELARVKSILSHRVTRLRDLLPDLVGFV